MEIPMLDNEEFAIASKLYSKGFKITKADRQERFKELLEYYNNLTGFGEIEPNAIMHHSLEQIGWQSLHEHSVIDPFRRAVADDASLVPAEARRIYPHTHRTVRMQASHHRRSL